MEAKLPPSASVLDLTPLNLPRALEDRVRREVDSVLGEHRRECRWDTLLMSGNRSQLIAAGMKYAKTPMVALLGDYDGRGSPTTAMPRWHFGNPMAPVIMRGSADGMRKIYGSGAELAFAIFKRWVRYCKITAFTQTEWDEATGATERRLKLKYCASYHFGKWVDSEGPRDFGEHGSRAIFKGRTILYSAHQAQYIRRLREISTRNDRLESRINRARKAAA